MNMEFIVVDGSETVAPTSREEERGAIGSRKGLKRTSLALRNKVVDIKKSG